MKAALSFVFLLITSFALQAQQYKPVDEKSKVSFTIKNFGLNTSGSLSGLKGIIKFNASDVSNSSFDISVDVNTINTGIDARDNHLKKEEYFDADKFPTIHFVSANILKDEKGYLVKGNLTIKGTTKTVSFPFTVDNENGNLIFTGNFTISRKDFNVGGGSAVMGNNVDVSLKVYAVKS